MLSRILWAIADLSIYTSNGSRSDLGQLTASTTLPLVKQSIRESNKLDGTVYRMADGIKMLVMKYTIDNR